MKQLFIFVFFILYLGVSSFAQAKQYGKIKVTEEQGIETLYTNSHNDLAGYRIQVFSGNANERTKAQDIKSYVENTYEVNAYMEYEAPLFKVRVGDFIDKIEAISLKHKLEQKYPNTYLVRVKKINL